MSRYHRMAHIKPNKMTGFHLARAEQYPDFLPPRVKDRDKLKHWHLFKGDEVMIIAGKDKKETGKIFEIDRDNNWVFVTGKKLVKKHLPNPFKMERTTPYVLKESGIHFSNVALLDPLDGKPCKIFWKKAISPTTGKETFVRFSKRSALPIPIPEPPKNKEDEPDFTEFDTPKEEVTKVTYFPSINECPLPPTVRINNHGHY